MDSVDFRFLNLFNYQHWLFSGFTINHVTSWVLFLDAPLLKASSTILIYLCKFYVELDLVVGGVNSIIYFHVCQGTHQTEHAKFRLFVWFGGFHSLPFIYFDNAKASFILLILLCKYHRPHTCPVRLSYKHA